MFVIGARVLIVASLVAALAACASSPYSPSGANALDVQDSMDTGVGSASCGVLFGDILTRERNGHTAGAINVEMDELGDRCSDRYQIFVDYLTIKSFAKIGAGGNCSEYARYNVEPEATRLAHQDGYCSGRIRASKNTPPARWNCAYSPTYNNDWHDDVVCSNGLDHKRPYLRGWDSFVTEAEIMESAREYERQLNGGG